MSNPKTIEELKQWYIDRNLPPDETTRFFIGKNYTGAKAFGIYMDENTEEFVVYKNKADGSRAIRYQGKDQAYAVNELYLKLKEEIANQKIGNSRATTSTYQFNSQNSSVSSANKLGNFIIIGISAAILAIFIAVGILIPQRGYYFYNNNYYYYQNGSWYEYENGWNKSDTPKDLKKHYKDYYQSYGYDSYYYIDSFENSSYYEEPSSSDSDSDWDSGDSWDSGATDWGSDW